MKKRLNRLISMLLAMILASSCMTALTAQAYFYDLPDRQPGFRIVSETKKENGEKAEKTVYKYNKDGTLAKEITDNTKATYVYDKKGHIIKSKSVTTYSDKKYRTKNTYEYDKNGNLVYYTFNEDDYLYGYDIYKYDNKGRLVENQANYRSDNNTKYWYYSNGIVSKKWFKSSMIETSIYNDVTYYNEDGTKKKAIEYNVENGKKLEPNKTTYKYKDGKLVKISADCNYGKFDTIYSYDENGNETKRTSIQEGDYRLVTRYTYDSNNNLIKEKNEREEINYTYDENGRLIKKVTNESEGTVKVETYTYDKYGNKTKMTYKDSDGESRYIKYKYEKFNITEKKITDGIYVKLSKNSYKYDGKEKKPEVYVCNLYGTESFFKGRDYTVKYKNNTKVGTAKVIISFLNSNYDFGSETVELTFKIKK